MAFSHGDPRVFITSHCLLPKSPSFCDWTITMFATKKGLVCASENRASKKKSSLIIIDHHWSSLLNPIPTSHLIWVLNCSPHFQNSHGFQSRPLHREPSLPAAVRSHHGTDVESAPGGWGTPWETQLGIFFMVASMDFFHDFFHGKMVV